MITARVLNSGATLNDFREIGSLDLVPGSEIVLVLRLYDTKY